jgi:hypothetical protein
MIEAKFVEIMNLELDGAATESQRTELRRYLETNPVARAHFEALGGLVRQLDARPLVEPPTEFHPRVVAAVDAAMVHPGHVASPRGFRGVLSPSRFRIATTFGLGLVTGVFLLAAVQFGRPGAWDFARNVDPTQVGGTMAPPGASEPVGSIDVPESEAGAAGNVELYDSPDGTVAEVSFDSDAPVTWIMEYDPATLSVTQVDTPKHGYFAVSQGEVRGIHPGHGPQKIVFAGRAEPVQSIVLKVVKDGNVVFERSAVPSR